MYFAILILGFFFQLFNKRLLFWVFTITLTVMACFRYGIGLDYFGYEYLYNLLSPSVSDEIEYGIGSQEILFRSIGSFLKGLGIPYAVYLALFAIVNMVYIAKLCVRYSKNPTLSMLIFFCFYYLTWTFSGIRQGVVIAVGLYYLLVCIEKNKTLRFMFIVFLLSLIHTSALVLIILYFVSKIDFRRNTLIVLSLVAITFSIVPTGQIISSQTWLPFYSRFYTYIDIQSSFTLLDFQSIGRLVFLTIAFVFYNQFKKEGGMSKKIIDLYIVSMIFYFGLQFSELIAARLAIFGKFLDVIILANVLYLYKQRINRLIYIYMLLILCALYLYKESGEIKRAVGSDSFFAPYVNVFNKSDHTFTSRYKLLIND
jgi:hypothetical protein